MKHIVGASCLFLLRYQFFRREENTNLLVSLDLVETAAEKSIKNIF